MKADVYAKLREILDLHPSGAPKSKVFDKILKILFTPEEADRMLNALAEKVLVFCREKDGKRAYGLLPTVPGLFEYPFMRGILTPELKKLGKLWDEYLGDGFSQSLAGAPTPAARVIPVERAVDTALRIYPYEEVKNIINSVDFIGLGQCACRVSHRRCDKPTEACLFFDSPARFLVKNKYARQISREEALDVLKRADEAGLIHTSTNSADRAGYICNCCKCCCVLLMGRTKFNIATAFAPSSFQVEIKSEECIGCGICADERCHMGAIEIKFKAAVVNQDKCIGCGLCVTACPTDALILTRRSAPPEIPATSQEMLGKVLTEKGKFEQFMRLMKA